MTRGVSRPNWTRKGIYFSHISGRFAATRSSPKKMRNAVYNGTGPGRASALLTSLGALWRPQ